MFIVRQLDENVWRDFVDQHPQGQVFHTPEMFQVFQQTEGYSPSLWAAVDGQGCPLALFMPVQITLMGGLLRYLTTRAVDYGSVLCISGDAGHNALQELLEAYNQAVGGRMLFTELRNLSDLSELQPILHDAGFVYEDHLNFFLDLTRSPDEMWSEIRSSARRNIRKARKLNVEIELIDDPDRIPDVYALLERVYQRIQVPLAHETFFQAAFETLYPQGMMEILVAKVDGVDIGVLTLLLYRGIVYYWYTGTLREYSACRAGDLLVWHTLEWGQQHGFHVLDFGGAGRPDEEYGVRDFKAKFGGKLVNYGRNVCVHAPLILRAGKVAYQFARGWLYGRSE